MVLTPTVQIVAGGIAVAALIHGGLHLTCDFPRISEAAFNDFDQAMGDDFRHKQPSYKDILKLPAPYTGICMVILMFIAYLLATHWFRRSLVKLPWPFHRMTGFNAFWYSHHLFVIVYILLIVHSVLLVFSNPWYQKSVSSSL